MFKLNPLPYDLVFHSINSLEIKRIKKSFPTEKFFSFIVQGVLWVSLIQRLTYFQKIKCVSQHTRQT